MLNCAKLHLDATVVNGGASRCNGRLPWINTYRTLLLAPTSDVIYLLRAIHEFVAAA
jgi:hypothetical protein